MRNFILVFISICFVLNGYGQSTKTYTDSVYISGKVTGFEKYKANSVQVIINDIVLGEQTTFRGKLKGDGSFVVKFPKLQIQDVYLEYRNSLLTIIVDPGKHYNLTFDAAKPDSTLSFTGEGATYNNDLQQYIRACNSRNLLWYPGKENMGRFNKLADSEKADTPTVHKQFLADRYNKERAFLTSYINQHKLDKVFIDWANTDLTYEYAQNLMRYVWLHGIYNKTKNNDYNPGPGYYDFIDRFPLSNPEASISSNYDSYLHEYDFYYLRVYANNRLDSALTMYMHMPDSYVKDALICHQFHAFIDAKQLDFLKPYMEQFKRSVINPGFRNTILNEYNSALYKLEHYSLASTSKINEVPKTEADSVFSKIIAKYPNKVVYVDFWATWCAPCRAEMPNSKTLQAKLKGKDVIFVYLGVESPEKTWKSAIAEMGIKGEHYLLKENDYKALSEKFQISGIPHYVLTNRKGNVVDGNAKRPGDAKLKDDIEILLAEN